MYDSLVYEDVRARVYNISIIIYSKYKSGKMSNNTYQAHVEMRMREIHERQRNINIRKRVKELMEEYSKQKHTS